MRNLCGIIVVLWLVCSCAHDHNERMPDSRPVSFSSTLSEPVMSRAADDRWDAADMVGIYMVPATANASDAANLASVYADLASNVPYVTQTGGAAVTLSVANGHRPIFYPESAGAQVNFVAYYPYMADTHTIYKVDVAVQSPPEEIDLLYHKGTGTPYNRSSTDVPLEFTHQLSKFKINLFLDDGVSANLADATAILTGFPTTADFHLSTGVLDTPGNTDIPLILIEDVDNTTASQVAFEAIIIPHTNSAPAYTRIVTFTFEGNTYSYTLDASAVFEAGVAQSYNFRFTGDDIVLTQNSIVDWDGGIVAWGDHLLMASKTYFELGAHRSSGHTVTLSINDLSTKPVWTLSNKADITTTETPAWITNVSLPDGTPSTSMAGWMDYALTFDVEAHIEGASRTCYICLEIAGLSLGIRVSQSAGVGPYINTPVPASFEGVSLAGETSKSFTIKTNLQVTDLIPYITANPSMITNLSASRSEVADDGSCTWTVTFDVAENLTLRARAEDLSINIGGVGQTVRVSQSTIPETEANCYMIAPNAPCFTFNPGRAFDHGGAAAGAQLYATVLWQDVSSISAPTITGTGRTSVVTIIPTGTPGNALVAIRTGSATGTIVWSYHIWVTEYTGAETYTNTYNTNNNGAHFVFMDRNLGATRASMGFGLGTGLFYQWGRKDPFPATLDVGARQAGGGSFTVMRTSATVGTVAYTIANPSVFIITTGSSRSPDWQSGTRNVELWGDSGGKAVYDPCPEGWRVPKYTNAATSPWAGFTTSNSGTWANGYNWGTNALYPAAGYRYNRTGELRIVGSAGCYWSTSFYNIFNFRSFMINEPSLHYRASSMSVRCVRE